MKQNEDYRVLELYEDGDSFLNDVLLSLERAKQTIDIETYIFELPEPGRTILKALEKRKHDGIEIRLIVDGVGSLHHVDGLKEWSQRVKIPLHIFNPLPWRRRWRWLLFPVYIPTFLLRLRSLNRRDHRKMVLIDKHIAFLGSINWAHVHFKKWNEKPWFDLAVKIEGDKVNILCEAFNGAFNHRRYGYQNFWPQIRHHFKERKNIFPLPHLFRLNHRFIFRFLFWRDLLWRIRRAKTRVYIMNAYFVPHRTLLRSLSVAARKGVEVVVLLPSESDVPVVKWFAPIFYRRLLKAGVQIREMTDQMIHTKAIIVDDWSLVGSNNLNYRSLVHDLEVDAVVDDPAMIMKILKVWQSKISQSRVICLAQILPLSVIQWIRYRIVLLIRYFV